MERRIRRLADLDYAGPHRYSLTMSTFQSAPVFTTRELVDCVCTQILRAARDERYEVIVYSAMPNHFHRVVDGRNAAVALPVFLKRAKQLSGYHGKKIAGRRIWQAGYYDNVLRPTESIREFCRYVVMNPVVAGLVEDPREYPFTGSGAFTKDELHELIRLWCGLKSAGVT